MEADMDAMFYTENHYYTECSNLYLLDIYSLLSIYTDIISSSSLYHVERVKL